MAVKNLLESPQAFQWVFYSLHLGKILELIQRAVGHYVPILREFGRCAQLQSAVRPERIVLFAPHFNQDFGFPKRSEISGIQALGPQFAVKRLAFAILPGASGLNKNGSHAFFFQPFLQRLFNEF